MGMLTLIAGGVGYLIVKGEQKDAEQDIQIEQNTTNIGKATRIVYQDPDTDQDSRDELRPIFFNTRSGNEEN